MQSVLNALSRAGEDIEDARAGLFQCRLAMSARELAGAEPYVVFEDAASDPFTAKLVRAARGEAGFQGIVTEIDDLPRDGSLVVCEAPVWHRKHRALRARGITGERVLVLFYFDNDPSGYWDFAKACGDHLPRVLADGGLTDETVAHLSDFFEHWLGARVSKGRFLPFIKQVVADYPELIARNTDKIVRVLGALADEESRAAYSRILFATSEQIVSSFSHLVWGPQQYMEIANLKPGDVVMNCGIGRGWELPYFLAQMRGEGEIHNFDPNIVWDSSAYAGFIGTFRDQIHDKRIIVGDRDGSVDLPMSFANMITWGDGDATEASVAPEMVTYPSRRLDSLMAEGLANRVDFIKMDVEGGERYILDGALETIRKHRPKLAVAIYHDPEHFWDYPVWLMDHLADYRFYVRQYGYSRFETLLYAIPEEQVSSGSGQEQMRNTRPARAIDTRPDGDTPVIAHFRDRKTAPRPYFAKNIHTLTRLFGHAWETARFTPCPQVEADVIVAVNELNDSMVCFTQHAYDAHTMRLTAAVPNMRAAFDYLSDIALTPDSRCAPVWSRGGVARAIGWSPSQRLGTVFLFDGRSIQREQGFRLEEAPAFMLMDENGQTVWTVAADRRRCSIHALKRGRLHRQGHAMLPGEFLALVSVRDYRRGPAGTAPAIAVRSAGGLGIDVLSADSALTRLGQIDWDDRFDLIATVA